MIYFDYAATTPPDERVLANYFQHLRENFANAGATYETALQQRKLLENSRQQFATALNFDPREIVFTSGATEANNLAIKGAVFHHEAKNPRVITLQTEHKAVLDPIGILAKNGVKTEFLPVQNNGLLDLDLLESQLKTRTTLVSVMAVNNETGVVQPLREIADLVHRYGAKFHIDAAQALGKINLNVDADLISFSGHKIYAPVGIGALYVRRLPKMRLQAQTHGGGQERGLRSGTSPTALISAFTLATELAIQHKDSRLEKVSLLNQQLCSEMSSRLTVSDGEIKIPHIENLALNVSAAEALARANAANIAISSGSACQSSSGVSHVLQAMRIPNAENRIRISISHLTTSDELSQLIQFLKTM